MTLVIGVIIGAIGVSLYNLYMVASTSTTSYL